jgi:hypothetical protein
MADYTIEHKGLDELIVLMKQFPNKLKQISRVGMSATLLALWENVPPYPQANPDSDYRRTGTLGRTLGSSESGGNAGGTPDIYTVKNIGAHELEGRFGTNLSYAEHVIGENPAWMHYRWWKLSSIIPKAQSKIDKIWEGIAQKMADFLNQKSGGVQ